MTTLHVLDTTATMKEESSKTRNPSKFVTHSSLNYLNSLDIQMPKCEV